MFMIKVYEKLENVVNREQFDGEPATDVGAGVGDGSWVGGKVLCDGICGWVVAAGRGLQFEVVN